MRALGVVELQGARERFEHDVRHAARVAALQALVVLDADTGERGDLLATQPLDSTRAEAGRPDLLRSDPAAAAGQELGNVA